MDTSPSLSIQQIIERISSDKALHDLLTPLLAEVKKLRMEISEVRQVLGHGRTAVKYLTVPEVAEMFRICPQTVRNRANVGKWPVRRDGRQMLFGPEEIATIRDLNTRTTPSRPSAAARRARNKQIRSLPVFPQD